MDLNDLNAAQPNQAAIPTKPACKFIIGSADPCGVCSKTVFIMDKITIDDSTVYHRNCFRCNVCTRPLGNMRRQPSAMSHVETSCHLNYDGR